MTPPYQPIRSPWIAGGVAFIALLALWTAPASPLALSRADVALGQGDAQVAVARYDAVAKWSVLSSHRQQAQRRAAHVLSNELGDSRGALQRLGELVDDPYLSLPQRAAVQVQIASLHQGLRESKKASHAWMQAVASCGAVEGSEVCEPGATGDWKMLAANALSQAGHHRRALNLLSRVVREHPELRQQANLERAQLQLRIGHIADALSLFEDVAAGDDLRANVAKLGVATCLERLGNLDEALAELDEVDLPDAVLESRSESMRSRAQWR